jgi:tRNA threonylcarbamoyladenosine biosynthesis protein TsaE
VHSYPTATRLTLHHADLYRLDRTADVDDLALHELAAFNGIVLIEWGDVAATTLGDHLEVRLLNVDDDPDDDAGEFTDPGTREIEIRAVGSAWAGRWDRLTRAMEPYRC